MKSGDMAGARGCNPSNPGVARLKMGGHDFLEPSTVWVVQREPNQRMRNSLGIPALKFGNRLVSPDRRHVFVFHNYSPDKITPAAYLGSII
jgi:hypothetical protein